MMYAALLTKTNRIARILAGSKKRIRTGKSRWLSATAQVLSLFKKKIFNNFDWEGLEEETKLLRFPNRN